MREPGRGREREIGKFEPDDNRCESMKHFHTCRLVSGSEQTERLWRGPGHNDQRSGDRGPWNFTRVVIEAKTS